VAFSFAQQRSEFSHTAQADVATGFVAQRSA